MCTWWSGLVSKLDALCIWIIVGFVLFCLGHITYDIHVFCSQRRVERSGNFVTIEPGENGAIWRIDNGYKTK